MPASTKKTGVLLNGYIQQHALDLGVMKLGKGA